MLTITFHLKSQFRHFAFYTFLPSGPDKLIIKSKLHNKIHSVVIIFSTHAFKHLNSLFLLHKTIKYVKLHLLTSKPYSQILDYNKLLIII